MRRTLLLALLSLPSAAALTLVPDGQARTPGHAAGTFRAFGSESVGGLTWGPDGTAYTLDGTRRLYHWTPTGRVLDSRVLVAPAALLDPKERFGPHLTLDGYRAQGPVRGPLIRVQGQRKGKAYQAAFTLSAGGRAVLGDPFSLSATRTRGSGHSADGRFMSRVESKARDGRARVQTVDRRGPGRATTVTLPAGEVRALEPSPDGQHGAALRWVPGQAPAWVSVWQLDLWDVKTGRVTSRVVPDRLASEAPLAQVHWADARRLLTATGSEDGPGGYTRHTLRLWNLKGPGPLWTRGQGETLQGAVPSPDGQWFLTVRDGSLPEIHRVSDGSFVRALGATVTAWTPLNRGRAVIAVDTGNGQGELRIVRRAGTPVRLGGLREGGVTRLAASPDGRLYALARSERARDGSAQNSTVSVLDAAGRTLHTWQAEPEVQRLGLTTDHRRVFAQVAADPWTPNWRGLSWNVQTGQPLPSPGRAVPVGNVLIREDHEQPHGQHRSRLTALNASGRVLWQERWRGGGWGQDWEMDPGGQTLVRASRQHIPGSPEQQALNLVRMDPRTGAVNPGLMLRPAVTGDPYRNLRLLNVAPDRRHALLEEWSGDGCGASFYGLRLADLGTRREVRLPTSLTRGLARDSGCSLPVPFPETAFSSDGRHLLIRAQQAQSGNDLNWYALRP